MAFPGHQPSRGLPPDGQTNNENAFRVDEGYSEDTRSHPWTDSSLRPMADHPADLVLPDQIMNLPEPQRSELAYAILRSLRTSSVATIVDRLTPLLHLDPITHLPLELILQVFTYLDPQTLLRASVISKAWRERVLETRLWHGLYIREGWRADAGAVRRFEDRVAALTQHRQQELRYGKSNHKGPLNFEAGTLPSDGWGAQHDAVESDDQVMEDPSSQASAVEDSVMRDFEAPRTPGLKSVFGANNSLAQQDSGAADEEEMYPSPPVSRQNLDEGSEQQSPSHPISVELPNVRKELISPSTSGTPKVNWRYLYKQRKRLEDNWSTGRFKNFQLPHPDHPAEGHRECIYTIQYSGKYLVSGSRDQSVRIWDLDTRRLVLKPLLGHRMSVLCLQFDASPEEDIIISGSSDTDVILWRFSTGEIIQRIKRAHRESVLNLRFDKRYLITCSRDKTIRIWSRRELNVSSKDFPKPSQPWGSEPGKFPTHIIDMMRQPSLAPQPLPPYSLLMTLSGHGAAVNAIQIHGDRIVSASGDRSIRIWNALSGDVIRAISAHSKGIACVQFDGKRIVSGSSDWTVRIFDCETAAEIGHLEGHNHLVRTVQAGFGDVPGSSEEELSEARSLDRRLLAGVYSGVLPDFHARTTGARNAGAKNVANMTAYGASLPPGGGGSKWGRIVSGSYDETVIIWKRDSEGNWIVGHRLRQEDAARQASGESRSDGLANHAALLTTFNQTIANIQAHQPTNPPAAAAPPLPASAQSPVLGQQQQQQPPQNTVAPQPAAQANIATTITNLMANIPPPSMQGVYPPNTTTATDPQPNLLTHPPAAPNAAPAQPAPANPTPQQQQQQQPNAQAQVPAQAPAQAPVAAAAPAAPATGQGAGNSRVFKLQFDARRIICCSQDPRIVGWDFANGDEAIEEVSGFFIGC
ncbi:MAG: hypothetical protein M1814_001470 [Vezdaea aestivalis]|nr:MAG: hypothetical protein M1814_001470 [Vezdaea aestivalis]